MDILAEIGKLFSVGGVAFLSLWGSVPVGLALSLSPVLIALAAAVGYTVGAGIILFLGEPVRKWFYARMGHRLPTDPNSRTRRLLDKYGVVGLGLLAPVTLGAQIGALLGLTLNMPRLKLFAALALGGLLWAGIFTALFALGVVAVTGAT